MKNALKQSIIFILIIAFSFLFGFVFDRICVSFENKTHSTNVAYAETIFEYSQKYDVDAALVFAIIKNESNFSNPLENKDGKAGVMMLSSSAFIFVKNEILGRTEEDEGLIYNPEKSIEYGIVYLSYLKNQYANDRMVLTAYLAGTDVLNAWLAEENAIENGMILKDIPNKAIKKDVSSIIRHYEIYTRILEQNGQ